MQSLRNCDPYKEFGVTRAHEIRAPENGPMFFSCAWGYPFRGSQDLDGSGGPLGDPEMFRKRMHQRRRSPDNRKNRFAGPAREGINNVSRKNRFPRTAGWCTGVSQGRSTLHGGACRTAAAGAAAAAATAMCSTDDDDDDDDDGDCDGDGDGDGDSDDMQRTQRQRQ
eukprot:gene18039-biopygen6018